MDKYITLKHLHKVYPDWSSDTLIKVVEAIYEINERETPSQDNLKEELALILQQDDTRKTNINPGS